MRRRARVRPPRLVWWFLLVFGTAMSIFIPIFLTRMGKPSGPGVFLFLVPPVLVALVGLIGVLRGSVPGMYYDVEVEDLPDGEGDSR